MKVLELSQKIFPPQDNAATLGAFPLNPTWVNEGAPIVPEYPSLLVLPLFVIATLLAVVVYRRKGFVNT